MLVTGCFYVLLVWSRKSIAFSQFRSSRLDRVVAKAKLFDHGVGKQKGITIRQPESAIEIVEHVGDGEPALDFRFEGG